MSPEEARIVVLEHALEQAQNTVSFMHGCLTDSRYKYAYPEQTIRHLEEWAKLVPVPDYCLHSVHKADCESCQRNLRDRKRMAEALVLLSNHPGSESRS